MGIVSPGFFGRGRSTPDLPPGQYVTEDFPVLSAGRRPRRGRRLAVHHHHRDRRGPRVDWSAFRALATESSTVDLHCVTRWSKLATSWESVSLDTLLAEVESGADYASVDSYGGYMPNLRWRTC
jgi:DMSO/TMAO reductase YedYZ molybdopterin-dependent catalytic subunit